ncbi:MAG: GTP-binding protein, partial [Proteobacteria bacterium]
MRTALTPGGSPTILSNENSNADAIKTPLASEAFVALVGSPNSGKTTLFNWLTGSRFKTVNYPGATVDYSIGKTHDRYGVQVNVMDTPGTYSLNPKSPDEVVTFQAIFNHKTFGAAKLIIAVADATHLARQLLLTRQLRDAGFPVVLAVTMSDLLKEHREILDVDTLSKELDVPVVLIDGRLGGGVENLVHAVQSEMARLEITPAGHVDANRMQAWTDERVEQALAENTVLSKTVVQPDTKSVYAKKLSTARERTRKLDRVLMHPVFGLIIFVALMGLLFTSIFSAATPAM